MPGFIIVMTSVDKSPEAEKIARKVIAKRLAGCVKIIGPAKSFYTWKGKPHVSKEWICLIKTKKKNYQRIESEIKKMHKYELPEIISLEIGKASHEYLKWLGNMADT